MNKPIPPSGHVRLHRSWLSVIPHILLAIVVTVAIYWVSSGTKLYGININLPFTSTNTSLQLPLYLLVLGVLLVRPIILMKDCHHTLGDHHLYSITGLCSARKDNVEIPFEDILGVRSRQTIFERILNVGTVIAWTATAERAEIQMHGLRYPDDVVHAIRIRIDSALQNSPRRSKPNGAQD